MTPFVRLMAALATLCFIYGVPAAVIAPLIAGPNSGRLGGSAGMAIVFGIVFAIVAAVRHDGNGGFKR